MVTAMIDDEPMRLSDALSRAYPHGGMTVSGLRRESRRGKLAIERISGKDFTTLAAIKRMRDLCLVPPKAHDFTCDPLAPTATQSTSSSTPPTDDAKRALNAAREIVRALRES